MKNDYVDSDGDLVSKDGKNFKLSFNGGNYIRNDAKNDGLCNCLSNH